MKLEKGTMLGPYRIEDSIGAGGMGEVYRARDTRLDRSVAVKVIPPRLADNEERLARFEREARVISSLSHPNICVLHDVGETVPGSERDPVARNEPQPPAVHYFVMELVDGDTLDERIRRGPMPPSEAIAIGIQIARALEHAHERGVIHRDLKPSNVMLTGSGVKLLDFGLSRLIRASEDEAAAEHSATVQRGITEEGVVLGTFQYMAPEQAEGKPADARTDIFALGAILYEMVSGQRAFEGKSRASLIAAIMAIDPPELTDLRPDTPPALARVIENCLEKSPAERWQSAHDVRIALELASSASGRVPRTGAPGTRRWNSVVPWIVAALALIAAAALFLDRGEQSPTFAFEVMPGALRYAWDGAPVSLSPDGRSLLVGMYAEDGGEAGLFIRELDEVGFRRLVSSDDFYDASWSWDGSEVLFFDSFEMKRIPAGGGPVTVLASTGDSRGASWGPDGTILFVPELDGGVQAIPATGGEPRAVTTIDREAGEISHARPKALPDGEHFLFLVYDEDPARRGIYVGSLSGEPHRFLIGSESAPVFAAPDDVLYHHEGDLYAQQLDMDELTVLGAPRLIAKNIAYAQRWANPGFSASANGVLAYHVSAAAGNTAVHAYSTAGVRIDGPEMYGNNLDIADDGSGLAVQSGGDQWPDIWVWDLARGSRTRLTSDEGAEIGPVWSPDGQWIAFSSPGNPTGFYKRRANGLGESELIIEVGKFGGEAVDWSADGRWLIAETFDSETQGDVMMIDLEADPPTFDPLVRTRFSESSARFSHDGRWISYEANDSGRDEIFVQPFPPDGSRWQVSVDGGEDARWSADGRTIYWISRGSLMAAEIDLSNGFRVGDTRKLFDAPSNDWVVDTQRDRFIFAEDAVAASTPIIVDTGWR